MMTQTGSSLFNYVRGAVRGTYGTEDLHDKAILFVGVCALGQEVLKRLCFSGATIYFKDASLVNYHNAYAVCGSIIPHTSESVDIIIDLTNGALRVGGTMRPLSIAKKYSYTQGIHDFYL
jgi:hypothetical protein